MWFSTAPKDANERTGQHFTGRNASGEQRDGVSSLRLRCLALTNVYPLGQRLTNAGVTERLERDRLMILEVLANRFLPPLADIVRREWGNSPQDADSIRKTYVHTFDLTGGLYRRVSKGEGSPSKFVEYQSMTLPSYFQQYDDVLGDRTRARLSRCAEDVRRNPGSTLLVAGAFSAHKICMCICAKMVYHPDYEVGERYRVVWHACSVLCLPLSLLGM